MESDFFFTIGDVRMTFGGMMVPVRKGSCSIWLEPSPNSGNLAFFGSSRLILLPGSIGNV